MNLTGPLTMIAAAIAAGSRHPSALAIAAAGVGRPLPFAFDDVKEFPGLGLEAQAQGVVYRLGRHDWATDRSVQQEQNPASIAVLTKDGEGLATFVIEDAVRPGAEQAVRDLRRAGFQVEIVSGDRWQPVQMLARRFDIDQIEAELLPAGKLVRIDELAGCGSRVERWASAGRRPRLHGAKHGDRHWPKRCRLRFPCRESFGRDSGSRYLKTGGEIDPAELCACRRL